MKNKLLVSIFVLLSFKTWSQNTSSANNLFKLYPNAAQIDVSQDIKDAIFLELDFNELAKIKEQKSPLLTLQIPVSQTDSTTFNLHTAKVLSDDFTLINQNNEELDYTPGVYYQGVVAGQAKSLAAWSFFDNEIMTIFSYNNDNYVLGVWKSNLNALKNIYILYKDRNVLFSRNFVCGTIDSSSPLQEKAIGPGNPEQLFAKCVKIYFEADYQTYLDKGSNATNVANFISAMFSGLQMIFTNESIGIELGQIFTWTTVDPYVSYTTSGDYLTNFVTNRPTFSGNLAHLITTRTINAGGVAYLDVLCNPSAAYGFTNIYTTFDAYPNYSWNLSTIAHELGHNFGSEHTHWCGWTGGAIDDCAAQEGTCSAGPTPAPGGGTIMSYCENYPLTNGFGTQPGNKIRAKYNAASCLTSCSYSVPTNNICGNAISLTSSTTCNYTAGTTNGANQSIASNCGGSSNSDDDVWYKFVAVATSHIVQVQGGAAFDAVINVRSSTSCTGTSIACKDATGQAGLETLNLTGLTIGTTYLIRVFHYGIGSGGGNFDICVTHAGGPAPENNDCASAIPLASATTCSYTLGTTMGATQSQQTSCGSSNPDDDVWYSFVAVSTSHAVQVLGATGFDAVIDVRTGACGGSNLSCTDAYGTGILETANLTGLTIGNTYLVRVYHQGAGSGTGNFQICVTHQSMQAPANDLCTSPELLTSSTTCNYVSGTTLGATQTIAGTCDGNGDDDVWYSFVAVSQSHQVKVQSGAGFDAVVEVRTTPNCSGTNITCEDASGLALQETVVLSGLNVGDTYMVRVYHYATGAGSGDFQICVTHTGQTCTYTISPPSLSFASTGGTGAVNVTTDSNCNWTATTNDTWITITSGATGTGNGTVTYTVANNTGTTQLTGTITIGDQVHTVAQAANNGCTYTVTPLNSTFSDQAATGTITVATAPGCNWATTANDTWITITSGNTGSGNGTATYSISANTGTNQRVGTITIAGQIHTVTQSGVSQCAYTIAPVSLNYNATGGSGTVNVSVDANCTWTSTANDSWITINSGGSGSGNGTVMYTVAVNTGANQRTGTMTVAGQTHTIIQDGVQCSYALVPTALSYSSSAGTGSINVSAATGCAWTAATTDAWITITSGSGTGAGTVNYSVSANTNTGQRLGSITVSGQIHTVVQNGTSSCSFALTPTNQTHTAGIGSGSISVSSSPGCSWTAISNDNWIFISSGNTGSGNGTVNYTISASTNVNQRVGTITVGGQIYTVTQSGVTCPPAPTMQNVGCALAANVVSNVSYQWYLSSTPIIGATSQFYTANQPGFYSVYITDLTTGCVVGSQPTYVACSGVGVDEYNPESAIVIYPNPTAGDFNIKASGLKGEEKIKISIVNVLGQTIYSSFVTVQNGEINTTVNNFKPSKGNYTVLFISDNMHVTKRLTVE